MALSYLQQILATTYLELARTAYYLYWSWKAAADAKAAGGMLTEKAHPSLLKGFHATAAAATDVESASTAPPTREEKLKKLRQQRNKRQDRSGTGMVTRSIARAVAKIKEANVDAYHCNKATQDRNMFNLLPDEADVETTVHPQACGGGCGGNERKGDGDGDGDDSMKKGYCFGNGRRPHNFRASLKHCEHRWEGVYKNTARRIRPCSWSKCGELLRDFKVCTMGCGRVKHWCGYVQPAPESFEKVGGRVEEWW